MQKLIYNDLTVLELLNVLNEYQQDRIKCDNSLRNVTTCRH